LLAGPARFAFGFLQPPARALQFFFRYAHPLLGDVRLQAGALERLCRGGRLAAVLFHQLACKGEKSVSLTQETEGFHPRDLSTEFVHKYVDRSTVQRQTRSATNGLRQSARDFTSCAQNHRRLSAFAPFTIRDIL